MNNQLSVNLDMDGKLSVSLSCRGKVVEVSDSGTFVWPLDNEQLEDIRWYLEDYLQTAFGVFGTRGERVAAMLPALGEAVFEAVFAAPGRHKAYVRARELGEPLELIFRSASAAYLSLPWELMRDPEGTAPLVVELAAVTRALPDLASAQALHAPSGRLRVLMVISRPRAAADVGYHIIARPLLEQIASATADIDLVVLRPPTLETFRRTLADAKRTGRPFHVVHFDGHGAWASTTPTGGTQGRREVGTLSFEHARGGAHAVSADAVAAALADGEVSVVVLNACESGRVSGDDIAATVAVSLLNAGAASVVAMAYSVYAVAAAEFMASFYKRLFAGDDVATAVTAGRQRMFQHDLRPSSRGDLPLADWLVPVHYSRQPVSFTWSPAAHDRTIHADQPGAPLALAGNAASQELSCAANFVPQDALIFELEAATRRHTVTVLHGIVGAGKTELAKAFSRWARDSGLIDVPTWVFWHSFLPGEARAGADSVISQIGQAVFGPEFDLAQRDRVIAALTEHRMLLVWDGFESVFSMREQGVTDMTPEEAVPPELLDLLTHLAEQTSSHLLITSRTREDWLGDVPRVSALGLTPYEAALYMTGIPSLHQLTAASWSGSAFKRLIYALDGNPLCLLAILPLLSIAGPEQLFVALQGDGPFVSMKGRQAQDLAILDASLSVSARYLTEPTRRLLPALALLQDVADLGVLTSFAQAPGTPDRFRADREQWHAALREAVGVGLLTNLGQGRFRLHPALTNYLAQSWRHERIGPHSGSPEAAMQALVATFAEIGETLIAQAFSAGAGQAHEFIHSNHGTLCRVLDYALDHSQWQEALAIAQPLHHFWDTLGMTQETEAWGARIVNATRVADRAGWAGALWLLFTWSRATRQLRRHELDEAEAIYRELLAVLLAHPDIRQQRQHVAGAYHQLGMVAQERGRLEEAENLYLKAAAERKTIDAKRDLAETYLHLGMIAQRRGKARVARRWYSRALELQHKVAAKHGMASTYYQLGTLAHRRSRLSEAESWTILSLGVYRELDDQPGVARCYHEMGMIAGDQGQLVAAEDWYAKSVTVTNDLGDVAGTAKTYHELGTIAALMGRWQDAEQWWAESFRLAWQSGDRIGAGLTAAQLGQAAEDNGRWQEALDWTVRYLATCEQFPPPLPPLPGIPERLARLTTALGTAALEGCWATTGQRQVPESITRYLRLYHPTVFRSDPS